MKKILVLLLALCSSALTGISGEFLAKVSWDYPTNTLPTGFKVYLATGALPYSDPSTKVFTVTNGTATSHNIKVTPGTSYRVSVTAFNEWQETDKGEEAVFTAPPLLSSPTNPRAAVIVYVP